MNTTQKIRPRKTVSRILAVSAVLGIALASGSATAAASTPGGNATNKTAESQLKPTGGHGGGGGDDCVGLVLLCL